MTTVVRKVITAIDKNGNAFSEVHTETQFGERWLQDDPTSLAQDSPELADWRTQYSGALEAERNALSAQVATLTTERDNALAQVEPLQAQVANLQAQLDALLNPPGPDLTTVNGAKQYIAAERFNRESGGITVGNQPVTTNRDEMPIWLGMVMDIIFNPGARTEFEYKPRGGENTVLSAEQVMRCYQCFAWYVNECFAVERRLAGELEAGTPIADVLAEIPAAWPQTAFEWTPPA